jgi:hypothetical protein
MALCSDPQLLILDEPTVAMDVSARREFWQGREMAAGLGRTLLFATHYLDEAENYADRVVVIADGKVIADAPAHTLTEVVGTREIRCRLSPADRGELEALPGMAEVRISGEHVVLRCTDSDRALRALLDLGAPVRGRGADPLPAGRSAAHGLTRLPGKNSPTVASTSGSSPTTWASSRVSELPSAHGPRPISVAARYMVW